MPKTRIGKIEAVTVVWAYTYHNGQLGAYLSKSALLMHYARRYLEIPGLRDRHVAGSINSLYPPRLYQTVHASFSRALRRLAEQGLIELDNRRSLQAKDCDGAGIRGEDSTFGIATRGYRRDSFFRLTDGGSEKARELLLTTRKTKRFCKIFLAAREQEKRYEAEVPVTAWQNGKKTYWKTYDMVQATITSLDPFIIKWESVVKKD